MNQLLAPTVEMATSGRRQNRGRFIEGDRGMKKIIDLFEYRKRPYGCLEAAGPESREVAFVANFPPFVAIE